MRCCSVVCVVLLVVLLEDADSAKVSASEPQIIEQPESHLYVVNGKPVTLNCKASGKPDPEITWYHNGQQLVSSNENSNSHRMILPSGQLFFMGVNSKIDVGTYYCNATNPLTGKSAISSNTTLEKAVLDSSFEIHPEGQDVGLGMTTTLKCRPPRGEPMPSVYWKKDDETLKHGKHSRWMLMENGNLKIKDVRKDDGGVYVCIANSLNIEQESLPAKLTIREKPRIIEGPKEATLSENNDAHFRCRATGDPEPTIIWKKVDVNMPQKRSFIQEDKSLKIEKVQISDEGVYVCRAENSVGYQEAGAKLTVQSQPSFVMTPRDKTVGVGRRVTFRCSVTGNPIPGVFWNKESSQTLMFPKTDYENGRMSVNDDGTLIIENVQKADAGDYICKGLSIAGSAYAKARLDVKDYDFRPPPIINHPPQNQTIAVYTTVFLECSASGDPTPNIRWYKNKKAVNLKDERFSMIGGTLKISDSLISDTGMFTCKAFSETGENSRSCYIQVEEHTNPSIIFHRTPSPSNFPGPPNKPIISDVTQTSVHLAWRSNTNSGASEVFAYTVEYFSHETGEGWVISSDTVREQAYVVRRLKPDTSYLFLIRAQNSYGLSLPSHVAGPVKSKGTSNNPSRPKLSSRELSLVAEKLSAKTVNLHPAEVMGSTAVKLTWEVRKHLEYIEGFHIRYRTVPEVDVYQPHRSISFQNVPERKHGNFTIETIPSNSVNMYTLHGLRKNVRYELDVQPYCLSVVGRESNSVQFRTLEDVPSDTPQNIEARMVGNNTLYISWEPPPKQHYNGLLRGYKIFIYGNESRFDREIQINSSLEALYIQNMVQDMTYKIQMLAYNRMGEGVRSLPIIVGPQSSLKGGLKSQPWFVATLIVSVGGSLWVVLCLLSVWLFRKKKNCKKMNGATGNNYMVENSSNKTNGFLKNGDYSTISKLKDNIDNNTNNNKNNNLQSPQSFNKVVDSFASSDIVPCILQQQYMIQPKSESTDSCTKQNISTSESNMESNTNPEVDDKAYEEHEHYERIDINSPNHYDIFSQNPMLYLPPPPEHPPPCDSPSAWSQQQQSSINDKKYNTTNNYNDANNYSNNFNKNRTLMTDNYNYSTNQPSSPSKRLGLKTNVHNFCKNSTDNNPNNNNTQQRNICISAVASERTFNTTSPLNITNNKFNNFQSQASLQPTPLISGSPLSETAGLDSDSEANLSQVVYSPGPSDVENLLHDVAMGEWTGEDGGEARDRLISTQTSSSVSSTDNECLPEAEFTNAVARTAKMTGPNAGNVVDPITGREKVRKASKHRQRARCSSPYSTDSNYGSIPHKAYPKSDRKRQMKSNLATSSQQHINKSQHRSKHAQQRSKNNPKQLFSQQILNSSQPQLINNFSHYSSNNKLTNNNNNLTKNNNKLTNNNNNLSNFNNKPKLSNISGQFTQELPSSEMVNGEISYFN